MTLFLRGVRALPIFALVFAALGLCCGLAFAQKITLSTLPPGRAPAVTRTAAVAKATADGQSNPNVGISLADCRNDLTYTFTATPESWPSGASLEVWAGPDNADCSKAAARDSSSGVPKCWRVSTPVTDNVNIAKNFTVRAQDVLVYYGGKATAETAAQPFANTFDSAACDVTGISGTGSFAISLYFMFLPSGAAADATVSTKYALYVDLVGPVAPSITDIAVQNQALKVTWGTTNDNDVLTYKVCRDQGVPVANAGVVEAGSPDAAGLGVGGGACSPIGSDGGTVSTDLDASSAIDTGTSDSAVADASSTDASNAEASVAEASVAEASVADASGSDVPLSPDVSSDLFCVSQSKTVTSYTFTGLDNDKVYTFVLSAQDAVDNDGDVGVAACQYASETSTFYDAYTAAGGQAGGGFCSMGRGPLTGLTSIAMGVAGFALLRRRRRS